MSWQELMIEVERLSRAGDKVSAEKLMKQALEMKRKNHVT